MAYITVTQSKTDAEILSSLVGSGRSVLESIFPHDESMPDMPEQIIIDPGNMQADLLYEILCKKLRSFQGDDASSYPFGKHAVIVDHVNPKELNPIAGHHWEMAIAMLILTFPELYWIFGWFDADDKCFSDSTCIWEHENIRTDSLFSRHSLLYFLSFNCTTQDPIFDGTGLRNFVLKKAKSNEGKTAPYISVRTSLATAIDDEKSYAYMNAYIAYRFGFCSFAVYRDRQMQELFKYAHPVLKNHQISFEDIFISFPDKQDKVRYSELGEFDDGRFIGRLNAFPGLKNDSTRIFVSSYQRHYGDKEKYKRNKKNIGRNLVRKPFSGMFHLWEMSGLRRKQFWKDDNRQIITDQDDGGHSAPGRLLQIAEVLIDRAEQLKQKGLSNIPACTWGAVMASTAREILGERTPTTSIEALSLKHYFEVQAECLFSGVSCSLCIDSRINDLKKETEILGDWFGQGKLFGYWQSVCARENAEMMILNRLISVLREFNQYDEEQICLNRVRKLHNNLWMRLRVKQVWPIFCWPIFRYIEFLLSSFPKFLTAIFFWIFALAGMFNLALLQETSPGFSGGPEISPLVYAIAFFTGSNMFSYTQTPLMLVTVIAIISGLGHLGIFISHLYSLVSRK